jgi:hypothetical protein
MSSLIEKGRETFKQYFLSSVIWASRNHGKTGVPAVGVFGKVS